VTNSSKDLWSRLSHGAQSYREVADYVGAKDWGIEVLPRKGNPDRPPQLLAKKVLSEQELQKIERECREAFRSTKVLWTSVPITLLHPLSGEFSGQRIQVRRLNEQLLDRVTSSFPTGGVEIGEDSVATVCAVDARFDGGCDNQIEIYRAQLARYVASGIATLGLRPMAYESNSRVRRSPSFTIVWDTKEQRKKNALLDQGFWHPSFEEEPTDAAPAMASQQTLQLITVTEFEKGSLHYKQTVGCEELERISNAVWSMPKDVQRKVFRALSLFRKAATQPDPGLANLQRCAAIEAVMSKPSTTCSTCGSTPGIKKAFDAFVEQYTNGDAHSLLRDNALAPTRGPSLYQARSDVGHGAFDADIDESLFGSRLFAGALISEHAARVCLMKWILAHEPAPTSGASFSDGS
jgi:hypothetical protein